MFRVIYMITAIWFNEPLILFDKNGITEIIPAEDMSYERKINAFTRMLLVLTLLGFWMTYSYKIIVACVVIFVLLYVTYRYGKKKLTADLVKEGFAKIQVHPSTAGARANATATGETTLEEIVRTEFQESTRKNPFGNVLLTDIMDDPERKSAPPAFNVDIEKNITQNVKRAVQRMNPTIENTNKQLYGDLWQEFELDRSNRAFYSTANTRVANDQGAFAKFLYGYMPSAKESGPDGAFARVQDNIRYTLY